jgi:small subunit ribosomal protein S6
MRNYEAMFVFRPELDGEKLTTEIKAIEKTLKTQGKGEVSFDNWGKRTLAYPIAKCHEGIYVNYQFTALPSAIRTIKGSLKHREKILRSIIFLKGR